MDSYTLPRCQVISGTVAVTSAITSPTTRRSWIITRHRAFPCASGIFSVENAHSRRRSAGPGAALASGSASTWKKKEPGIWVDNTARLACDAAAREVSSGRVNRDSRSTTFGVKPANDSSEAAMTTPSFVSILQAGGTSRAKQQPVNFIGDSSLSGRCPHKL